MEYQYKTPKMETPNTEARKDLERALGLSAFETKGISDQALLDKFYDEVCQNPGAYSFNEPEE